MCSMRFPRMLGKVHLHNKPKGKSAHMGGWSRTGCTWLSSPPLRLHGVWFSGGRGSRKVLVSSYLLCHTVVTTRTSLSLSLSLFLNITFPASPSSRHPVSTPPCHQGVKDLERSQSWIMGWVLAPGPCPHRGEREGALRDRPCEGGRDWCLQPQPRTLP